MVKLVRVPRFGLVFGKGRVRGRDRYTGRGCPCTHLRVYSQLMRGMSSDEAQLIMLFLLSLSSVAQSWFATLDASRKRT